MEKSVEKRKIEIGDDTIRHLNVARKWTMFLAVTGFIFFGLVVALGLMAGTFLAAFSKNDKIPEIPDIILLAAFICFALLNFFPIFFLFRFSTHARDFVSSLDAAEMHKAFRFLKMFFLYIGILVIIIIISYITLIVISGSSLAFLKGA